MIAAVESARAAPSLPALQRILNAANYQLVVVDVDDRLVPPLEVWADVVDGAGRRFPPHLDTILDPEFGEWWADGYGLARPRRDASAATASTATTNGGAASGRCGLRSCATSRNRALPSGFRRGDEWRADERDEGDRQTERAHPP